NTYQQSNYAAAYGTAYSAASTAEKAALTAATAAGTNDGGPLGTSDADKGSTNNQTPQTKYPNNTYQQSNYATAYGTAYSTASTAEKAALAAATAAGTADGGPLGTSDADKNVTTNQTPQTKYPNNTYQQSNYAAAYGTA